MGVPQVVDARADLPKYFEVGKEIVTFAETGELKSKVEELLQAPPRAEEIGVAARRRVLDQHTHMHRAQRLLESVGMLSAQKPVGQESVAD
jgi:spore maturation protein CgeB